MFPVPFDDHDVVGVPSTTPNTITSSASNSAETPTTHATSGSNHPPPATNPEQDQTTPDDIGKRSCKSRLTTIGASRTVTVDSADRSGGRTLSPRAIPRLGGLAP